MESCIWNTESDTLAPPCLCECTILKSNVEIGNNPLEESHEDIYDEHVQVSDLGPEKRVCNVIFLIVIYKYNNNGFL